MKQIKILFFSLVLLVTGSSLLWAGGADNKTNWSAEYISILNRNAATDAADIAMYNPAGVVKMENGLYANLSGHYFPKDYNNRINGQDFETDEPSIVPGFFAVYKKDDWAGYFAVSNVVGGGEVDFSNGNATTQFAGFGILTAANAGLAGAGVSSPFFYTKISNQRLEAEQIGLGYTLGGAYKINEMWAVSLGVRYVRSDREMQGNITVSPANSLPGGINAPLTAEVDFESDADGFGGIIGVNFSPSADWNIGLHYDTRVSLDYEQTVHKDNFGILPNLGISNGGERMRDLPAILAAGVSYQVIPALRVEANLTYYFNQDAGFKDIPGTPRDESAVDNGYDLGIGFEYAVTDTLKATVGYLYTDTGVDAKDMTPELPELDAHTLGVGLRYQLNQKTNLTASLGHVFYQDASYVSSATGAAITYEKEITFVGLGIQYKFF